MYQGHSQYVQLWYDIFSIFLKNTLRGLKKFSEGEGLGGFFRKLKIVSYISIDKTFHTFLTAYFFYSYYSPRSKSEL